jgi:predicted CoA-substrate-specific enzyme activase
MRVYVKKCLATRRRGNIKLLIFSVWRGSWVEDAVVIVMGMDIGSTTSKCLALGDGYKILGSSLVRAGIGTNGPQEVYDQALEICGLSGDAISCCIATGYGRERWSQADGIISELLAHALGSHFLFPEVHTIIDIGGQDAKVIALDAQGQMCNFVMNDKCAAGTGRFLDVMAGILKKDISELEQLAASSKHPVTISNTCTVFAESEVISQLAAGAEVPDVVGGICASVAGRVASLARRVGVTEDVCMSGGVAQNGGVRKALETLLEVTIYYSPMAQITGALGAAISAAQKMKL